jgi:signal transduction histidine kinase
MSLPARLFAGMFLGSIAALVVVALISTALQEGEMAGEGNGLIVTILLAGLPVALAAGGAGFLYGRSLVKQLGAIRAKDDPLATSPAPQRGDALAQLGTDVQALADTMRTRESVLRQTEKELREAREQLREVAAYLETAREGERKRIARNIHDELGQSLSTLKLDLSLLQDELGSQPGPIRNRIEGMALVVGASIKSVKRIISELRPQVLDDLGLTAALEWEAEEFQKRTGIPVELSIYPQEILLEPDQSTALFRIFQETLANVTRHASAHSVRASLTEIDGVVELEVRDDGCGIRREQIEDPRSFGLVGIRERAHSCGGTADIEGSPEMGTRVRVRFELQEEK